MTQENDLLFAKVIQADRVALGKAMTLVESERPDDRQKAVHLLQQCEKYNSARAPAIRLTVSGAPGAGKSTFIEAIGLACIAHGLKAGVITVDPTSTISHGSILGDKSRMTALSVSPEAFIRSSAAGNLLGGLGRRSFELMTLLESAGYHYIFLETVGVGQSEHTAWQLTDGFILVLQPGSGDELQGIKRGITELADFIIVNKADGQLADLARTAKAQYQSALHFFSPMRPGWTQKVLTCSSLKGDGIDEIWNVLRLYHDVLIQNSSLQEMRKQQKAFWLSWSLERTANQLLINHPVVKQQIREAHDALLDENVSLFEVELEIEKIMQRLIDPLNTKKDSTERA